MASMWWRNVLKLVGFEKEDMLDTATVTIAEMKINACETDVNNFLDFLIIIHIFYHS